MKTTIFILPLLVLLSCNRNEKLTKTISSLPSFDLMLLDSATIFHSEEISDGRPSLFLYFNTDCPHCQAETKNLLQHIDSFKKVNIFFLTPMSLDALREYNNVYHLSSYKNIMVGRDHSYSFAKTFRPKIVPFMVIYNSKKKLVKIYKGDASIEMIYDAVVHS